LNAGGGSANACSAERIHEDAAVRQRDLVQLGQIASGYSSRERFLTELTLDPPDATSDQAGVPHLDEDYLILSTIHSAKGQEWKSVFLLNTVDGCLPSDLADPLDISGALASNVESIALKLRFRAGILVSLCLNVSGPDHLAPGL
jgi:superfamily I DNA/RNA helicase